MSRPRMTKAVREGLWLLAEFGRSYLEGDVSESEDGLEYFPTLGDAGSAEHDEKARHIEAAQEWIEKGGLS